METVILKYILTSQGSVDREELECNLGDASLIAQIIRDNSDKFVACSFNGTWKVVVRSRVRLCRVKECQRVGCEGLHLCKNLLLSGDCQFQLSRRGCSFPHDLKSENNLEVLRKFGLETLKRTEVCLLLLQSDNTLLPQICHDYNNRSGCQGECPRLHICERYLCQDCNCHRPHDFSDPQTRKLLRDKHIPEQLLGLLKSVYANKQALRQADKGNRCRESESEAAYGLEVNEYEAEDSGQDDQKSTEETPTDWTAYDSDSSSSVCTNQSESSRHGDPRKREGRTRDRRRGNRRKAPSAAGNVEPNSRYRQYDRSDAKSDGKPNSGRKDKTQICMFYIRGKCKDEGSCTKAHDKMPYRWKIKRSGLWDTMADNEKIESEYCDPQNTYSTTCPPLHFDTMICGNNKVRRVSTVNSVVKPHYSHTTDWLWYFQDESGQWIQYSDDMDLFEQRPIIITSQKLEELYQTNNEDVVKFLSFELSFKNMIQTDRKYGTEWLVRRRPRFVSAAEVEAKRNRSTRSTAVPDYWDKTQIPQTGHTNYASAFATKANAFSTSSRQATLATTLKTSRHTSPVSAISSSSHAFSSPGSELATASATKSQFTLPAPETTSIFKSTTTSATKSSKQPTCSAAHATTHASTSPCNTTLANTPAAFATKANAFSTSSRQTTLATTLKTSRHTSPVSAISSSSHAFSSPGSELATASATKLQFTLPAPETTSVFKSTTTSATKSSKQPACSAAQATTYASTSPCNTTLANTPAASETKSQVTLHTARSPKPVGTLATPESKAQLASPTTFPYKSQSPLRKRFPNSAFLTTTTTSQFASSSPCSESQMTWATSQTMSVFDIARTANKMDTTAQLGTGVTKSSNPFLTDFSPSKSNLSTLTTPQTMSVFDITSTANKVATTKPQLSTGVTKSSNPFLTDFSPSNSQSHFTLTTPQTTTAKAEKTATPTTPQFTSAAAAQPLSLFLLDLSSNSLRTTTKSQFASPTPQKTHAATKSAAESRVALTTSSVVTTSNSHSSITAAQTRPASTKSASLQFAPDTNSPTAFSTSKSNLSSSKSHQTTATSAAKSQCSFTTTAQSKMATSPFASGTHSSNALSGSSTRSQVAAASKSQVRTPTSVAKSQFTLSPTPAIKSAAIPQGSFATTSAGNSSGQFPTLSSQTTIAQSKSQVTPPKTATKSQFESERPVRSASTNTATATFKSASPFGYAAVSFPGASASATGSTMGSTTGSTTATEKANKKQKTCVIA